MDHKTCVGVLNSVLSSKGSTVELLPLPLELLSLVDRPRNLTFKRDYIWYKHIKIALSINMFLFTFTSCQL